ncbi:nickel pincer cofactor biosynthesis protein LarB [Labrenzia sp. PHM005]|uniref:nickel pincer cofactor biosynthesis protein LarB n=1 Tax=Labrenzia sp. PHM005 TaxID=2590016 RepID=UPI0011403939|nr:nickel pincer cofactor biosynthesis protein LarB [Labrenzia sp. PHM005]QDG75395.1 nickel pincer cofactor biosynthesis protein LarB [Labrenzia sp. PHM005]
MTHFPAIIMDEQRRARTGVEEAVLCEQKTVDQIGDIIRMSQAENIRRLYTRLSFEKFDAIPAPQRDLLRYRRDACIAVQGEVADIPGPPQTAIVSGGSSDAPVALEVQETLAFHGHSSLLIQDVGVAGLWRLLERVKDIAAMPVVIAVAGMDAALPTVLSGLIPSIVIGVPSSTGYGAARGGETALNAMLASCSPGLTVTNIDNGYGAACAAMRALNMLNNTPATAAKLDKIRITNQETAY